MSENLCEKLGHDWEIYTVTLEPHNHWHDIEQAGYCKRCGEDTHGQYPYAKQQD